MSKRWKPAADWLEQVIAQPEQKSQWLTANYRDVVLSKFGEGRIGVMGDAAHAMSPQLGQGANMALLDAWALGQAVQSARKMKPLIMSNSGKRIINTVKVRRLSINF